MPIYLVVATKGKEAIELAIETVAPYAFDRIKDDAWLVDDPGTYLELYDKLGIYDGSSGEGFLSLVNDYAARAHESMWFWLMAHCPDEDADYNVANWPAVEPL